jgi:CRISPR-associated endonuclease/helicase Cas3
LHHDLLHGKLRALGVEPVELAGATRSSTVGHVVRLRGGMGATEDAWMLNPGGLTVISTTLDQLGSRLLCRAYGSSRWTAPVHAGLVGNDALRPRPQRAWS